MGANRTRYSLEGNSPRLLLPITLANVLWTLIEDLEGADYRRPCLLQALLQIEKAFRLKPNATYSDIANMLDDLDVGEDHHNAPF